MLSLTKPKYVVPISAMHRMMRQYSTLAESTGVAKQNVLIVDEAGIVEFDQNGARIKGEIQTENIFVDGIGVGDVGEVVLRDRKVLAEEGIVVVIVTVDKHRSRLIGDPDIVSRGFVYMKQSEQLIKEATDTVKASLGNGEKIKNWLTVREKIVTDLEKFLYRKTQRKPMVVPVIVDV
jgi:ribonuclease J